MKGCIQNWYSTEKKWHCLYIHTGHFLFVVVSSNCIQTCIGDILIQMNSNKHKLNTVKTEVMPVGSASRVALVESECANISGNSVPFKTSVKYLRVHTVA